MNPTRFVIGALLCAALSSAFAQVSVSNAWAQATVPGQTATGAFMRIDTTQDMHLIAARSPLAASTELHKMSMDGGVMRMRPLPSLDVPAGKPVDLTPGGNHLMVMGLKSQAKPGTVLPITLVFEDSKPKQQTVDVSAMVRALGDAAPMQMK